ncbi:enoyl-CoA hydratase family protein [Pseudomaricurvus alkylphenolicus]|uniref:enoyl-CoA hydratase family protein n=1 Tax=Pseudomaricurvus alkylphenolicus TaxID=1306991 RepID=UPI0014222C02|nr:enoyl-CoA hydratase family protein [Pseudomaricurvus alkylphenolicus]NIB40324.1 enoyl-CoA hydratase family protein [Pseudomaricurvus alkylphenolicus]
MTISVSINDNIAEVVMSHPPVNSITVGDTWKLDEIFKELSEKEGLRCIILTAEGRGFNAGIDIKEMQSVEGWDHLLGSGEACYSLFHSIYNCKVPVIAAVNDFCMGLGVGIVASCDIIIASKVAKFGLPEVDNGALGCASHLAKLVAPMKLREMSLTCRPATAEELAAWGSVAYITEPEDLMAKAREVAGSIAKKQKDVVKFAKAALNHLDVFELDANYRMEQGYTYQLNFMGDGEEARNAFVRGERIITR